MHIRLKSRAGNMLEALSIYRYLRHELVESGGVEEQGHGVAAA
jgi:hypothetical protein